MVYLPMRVVVDKPMRMGGGLGENTQYMGKQGLYQKAVAYPVLAVGAVNLLHVSHIYFLNLNQIIGLCITQFGRGNIVAFAVHNGKHG